MTKTKEEKEKSVFAQTLENYWYYYKWPTLGGIVVFFVVAIAMINFSTPPATPPDATVLSVFARPLTMQEYELQSHLEGVVSDVDGNDTIVISMEPLYVSEKGTLDSDTADNSKFESKIAHANGDLVLLDKANLERYRPKDFLAPLADFDIDLTAIPEEDIVYRDGVPVAVRLSDSKILIEKGFIIDSVYAGIMFVPEDASEQLRAQRQNAANMLKALLVKAPTENEEPPAES